ncbi:hypothetical protein DTW90_24835 [Neorhizobium sp. P12A]|uniref:hypothetical protein n=1 Tax=Neorhizobium sp. P12A TaxID=2268027 RepID=UPI0011EDF07A|nr:hypothetical protein [Neorhizobium sp. P12A]KAA0694565.1 hypothetical protein DTW90_24835 [Neorhizobium sp. P12A]
MAKQTTLVPNVHGELRDGTDMLPERVDIMSELFPAPRVRASDRELDEALRETFPASDPAASGKFE